MSKMGSIWTSKNFLTNETSSTSKKSVLSINTCKIKNSLSIKVNILNLETKLIWTHVKNGLNLDLKKFFDDWNLHCHQEIIAVYQNMQNKKKLINISQDNEFGDKKIIWRQALIVHKRRKYFFEGWNHLDLLDIIPV